MPMSADDKKEIMEYEEQQKREWNKTILAHIKRVQKIEKPSVQFPFTIEKACEDYFELCEEDGVKPSVSGLSLALGTNRETLLSWVKGDISIESADIIKKYFSLIEIFDETALKDNRTNAVAGIFGMKNNFNYKDQVEVKRVDDKDVSIEEIERKYREQHLIVSEPPKEIEVVEAKVEKPKGKSKK